MNNLFSFDLKNKFLLIKKRKNSKIIFNKEKNMEELNINEMNNIKINNKNKDIEN